MLSHIYEGTSVAHSSDIRLELHECKRYYAEVPTLALDEQSRLIEQVIHFAFDTLGACHLEVRVCTAPQEARRSPRSQPP
jgi:hypothetical protein